MPTDAARGPAPAVSTGHLLFALSMIWLGAMGLASVVTNVRGCREVVERDVTGLIVECGDVGALAAAIQRLVDDPELRSRMGAAARRRVIAEFDERALHLDAAWSALRAV